MPQDAHSFEKLVETSNKALLKAKTTGKNKVISYPFD